MSLSERNRYDDEYDKFKKRLDEHHYNVCPGIEERTAIAKLHDILKLRHDKPTSTDAETKILILDKLASMPFFKETYKHTLLDQFFKVSGIERKIIEEGFKIFQVIMGDDDDDDDDDDEGLGIFHSMQTQGGVLPVIYSELDSEFRPMLDDIGSEAVKKYIDQKSTLPNLFKEWLEKPISVTTPVHNPHGYINNFNTGSVSVSVTDLDGYVDGLYNIKIQCGGSLYYDRYLSYKSKYIQEKNSNKRNF